MIIYKGKIEDMPGKLPKDVVTEINKLVFESDMKHPVRDVLGGYIHVIQEKENLALIQFTTLTSSPFCGIESLNDIALEYVNPMGDSEYLMAVNTIWTDGANCFFIPKRLLSAEETERLMDFVNPE